MGTKTTNELNVILNDIIDTDKNVLKDSFNEVIWKYCEDYSVSGIKRGFSRVPLDVAYQISVETIGLFVSFLKEQIANKPNC